MRRSVAKPKVAKEKERLCLRTLVEKRLLQDVFEQCHEKWAGWMVLVLDEPGLRVISSSIGMYDLAEHKITLAEDLTKKRAPFRDMGVIYLLSPTEDSVTRLISDWTPSETRKEPLYGDGIFVYFLSKLQPEQLNRIKRCKALVKRIKGMGEVNIDFLAKEAGAFHFDMQSSFRDLYLRRPSTTTPAMIEIADKLVTVCATMNEYPHIRFRSTSDLCKTLADIFHNKMNEFVGNNTNWWYYGDAAHSARDRSTLLLLDRADDCLSPLMHEFTYQAMVNDLLPIEDDRITFQAETVGTAAENEAETIAKDALLNENDSLWVELRGKHIADVIQILSNRIREIVNSGSGAALSKTGKDSGKALSLQQMANALKALPEYREVMSKLSQHMHISHQCMEIFNRQNLLDMSELEQTLATGKNDEGRAPRLADLISEVETALQNIPSSMMRLRLLAILITSQNGVRDLDKDRLFVAARLSDAERRALMNLQKLGVSIVQGQGNNTMGSIIMGKRLVSRAVAESDSEYSSSRYACELKNILNDMVKGTLSIDTYPSVLPLPEAGTGAVASARTRVSGSVRKGGASSKWSRSTERPKSKAASYSGARQIVFVVGGMCYSELRALNDASKETEFVGGSTRFINPTNFIQDLSMLS
mmetsp:Transcript_6491/g.8509  ORF Transcript_6491/g.8509 Transcript_6491/m.8509 type:complete len:646 (-) Transcript_6491:212-2149(-)